MLAEDAIKAALSDYRIKQAEKKLIYEIVEEGKNEWKKMLLDKIIYFINM